MDILTAQAGRGGYGTQSGARDQNGDLIQHDVSGPGANGVSSKPIVSDSGQDAIQKLADELGYKLDDSTKDALVQYDLNEKAAEKGYQRSIKYNEEMYPALVAGLQKAGLNPFLALSSLSGGNLQNGASNSGGNAAEIANSKREAGANIARSLTTLLGIIAAAVIAAL